MLRTNLPTLFILVSMVIDALGWALMIPVAPQLIMELTGADLAGFQSISAIVQAMNSASTAPPAASHCTPALRVRGMPTRA